MKHLPLLILAITLLSCQMDKDIQRKEALQSISVQVSTVQQREDNLLGKTNFPPVPELPIERTDFKVTFEGESVSEFDVKVSAPTQIEVPIGRFNVTATSNLDNDQRRITDKLYLREGLIQNIDTEETSFLKLSVVPYQSAVVVYKDNIDFAPNIEGVGLFEEDSYYYGFVSQNETLNIDNQAYPVTFEANKVFRFMKSDPFTQVIEIETELLEKVEDTVIANTLQSDEVTGVYTTCNDGFTNPVRTAPDLPNAINVGNIDDRTCYADYYETEYNGRTWGAYNIVSGSNHLDGERLQPRMERTPPRAQSGEVGTFARFAGTVRILEVGDAKGERQDGSYFMQAKGQHIGNPFGDPAICLYVAMPIYENGEQVSFDIFREQINYRAGSGIDGRQHVFLMNVKKNEEIDVTLEVGFRLEDGEKVHYADATIKGEAFNWNIPEPELGTQSGIRYGVYRVHAGRAQMRWTDTTYEKVD